MGAYEGLFAALTAKAREEGTEPGAVLTGEDVARAEAELGFRLHPMLAELYRTVGNGGFGPDYGLLPLEDAVDLYVLRRAAGAGNAWAWPTGVLPILDWGCDMNACVDCRSDEGTVLLFEPNPGEPEQAWWIEQPSLEAWLRAWIDGRDWATLAEAGEDMDEMPPWDGRAARLAEEGGA